MKNTCFLFIMLLVPFVSRAERIYSSVEKEIPFINYTLTKEASVLELAKKFGINTREFAAFNFMEQDVVLAKGRPLRVPVRYILKWDCSMDCVEVYYEVQPGEGLYRIGKNFGYQNTSILKKLNSLRSDALSKGQVLLVGYIPKEIFDTDAVATEAVSDVKTEPGLKEATAQPAFKTISVEKDKADSAGLIHMQYAGEGFFKPEYQPGRQQAELTASTFKTETGWRDGKFYVLVDKIEAGKVIKIKNSITGAVIYAKVLGELPHIGKKDLVKIRLSSAGAIALGFTEDQLFTVDINY